MASNRVIGINNKLPWHLPEDMNYFVEKTRGHIVVMGRKSFDSLNGKPLPGRLNVVVSRQLNFSHPSCWVVQSVEQALERCRELIDTRNVNLLPALLAAKLDVNKISNEVFIVGGEQIYRAAMPWTDRIYLTEIKKEFKGDTYFPEFPLNEFGEVSRKPCETADSVKFDFVVYDRR